MPPKSDTDPGFARYHVCFRLVNFPVATGLLLKSEIAPDFGYYADSYYHHVPWAGMC